MKDIFDAKIVCERCDLQMKPAVVAHRGFEVRVVQCPKCNEAIVHPADAERVKHYDHLKNKQYTVKLRVVGNSHAISIPKELLEFMNEMDRMMHRQMSDMVRLCFEDFGKLRVEFMNGDDDSEFERKKKESSVEEDL
jgi:hypothetical protein